MRSVGANGTLVMTNHTYRAKRPHFDNLVQLITLGAICRDND